MIVRVQIAGQELNPITIAPYIKGEKGDKGDPGMPAANSISADPNNAAVLGSDGGIYVPAGTSCNCNLNLDGLAAVVDSVIPLI